MTDNPDLDEAIDILRNWKGIMPVALVDRVQALLAKYPERPKLLSCPFCGGEAQIVGPRNERDFFVICGTCEGMTQDAVSAETAAASWNRRAKADNPDYDEAIRLLRALKLQWPSVDASVYWLDNAEAGKVQALLAKAPTKPASGPVSGGKAE